MVGLPDNTLPTLGIVWEWKEALLIITLEKQVYIRLHWQTGTTAISDFSGKYFFSIEIHLFFLTLLIFGNEQFKK